MEDVLVDASLAVATRRCRDSSTLMPGAVFHVRADHAAARAHYVLRVLPGEVDHR